MADYNKVGLLTTRDNHILLCRKKKRYSTIDPTWRLLRIRRNRGSMLETGIDRGTRGRGNITNTNMLERIATKLRAPKTRSLKSNFIAAISWENPSRIPR